MPKYVTAAEMIEEYNEDCASYLHGLKYAVYLKGNEGQRLRSFNQINGVDTAFGCSLKRDPMPSSLRYRVGYQLDAFADRGWCPRVKELVIVNPGAEAQMEADYQAWLTDLNRRADEYERLEQETCGASR